MTAPDFVKMMRIDPADPAVLAALPEVQAMLREERNKALREASKVVRGHGYLSQIRIDTLEEAAERIDAMIQEAPHDPD